MGDISGLGLTIFLLIGGMAFWMLFFLLGFIVPYWISLGIFAKIRPKKIFEEDEKK